MNIILKNALNAALNAEVGDFDFNSISGGDINDAYRLRSGNRYYFAKTNAAGKFPKMFEAEAAGLSFLREAGIKAPHVLAIYEERNVSVLLLEWLNIGEKSNKFWEHLAIQLAQLHQQSAAQFGLDHDNYIGSLQQLNKWTATWNEFFVTQRLMPQVDLAIASGLLNKSDLDAFEKLILRLDEIFSIENPALLHGDFWSGNYMCDENSNAWFIDPAVYYGHRIMDIGMSKLFGGFDDRFYESYNEAFSLPQGWMQMVEVANLYPLLVHINLFGGSYVSQVRLTLQQFI